MPSSCRMCPNFFGSAKRRSVIIARSSANPAVVKNNRGARDPVSSRISPRSTRPLAIDESFGFPASEPPRQTLSIKPSATVGYVEKNISSSRRMYSRSPSVNPAAVGWFCLLMRQDIALSVGDTEPPNHRIGRHCFGTDYNVAEATSSCARGAARPHGSRCSAPLRWRNAHLLLENALECSFGLIANRLGDGSDRTQRPRQFIAR